MVGYYTKLAAKEHHKMIKEIAHSIVEYAEEVSNKDEPASFIIGEQILVIAAWQISNGEYVHPKWIYGKYWVLYYQAWLWKWSRIMREWIIEGALKKLYKEVESGKEVLP